MVYTSGLSDVQLAKMREASLTAPFVPKTNDLSGIREELLWFGELAPEVRGRYVDILREVDGNTVIDLSTFLSLCMRVRTDELMDRRYLILFLSGISKSKLLKISSNVDYNYDKLRIELLNTRGLCEEMTAGRNTFLFTSISQYVAIARKGSTVGVVNVLRGIGIRDLISVVRGDIVLYFKIMGGDTEIDGIKLTKSEACVFDRIRNILTRYGMHLSKLENGDKRFFAYVSNSFSIMPNVVGNLNTVLTVKLSGFLKYFKDLRPVNFRIEMDDRLKKIL